MFIGDSVGQAGQVIFQSVVPRLVEQHKIDAVFVNGENSAAKGKGIGTKQVAFFKHLGVKVITSGNHIWDQRDFYPHFKENEDYVLRPANYPSVCPGKGYTITDVAGVPVGIVNLQGRVFMQQDLDCPFKTAESLLLMLRQKCKVIFVDFHAETTSEKQAIGYYLDGKVSGLFGTHTHVQTADEMILPKGSAYITDLGFCGALYSTLGVKKEIVIQRFLTQMPQRFEVEKDGPLVLSGVIVDVDTLTGKAQKIERVRVIEEAGE